MDKSVGSDDLSTSFAEPENASNLVKLESIHRFQSTVDAVEDLSSIADGKLSKNLKSFLQEAVKDNKKLAKETLLVSDNKLGTLLNYTSSSLRAKAALHVEKERLMISDSPIQRWSHQQEVGHQGAQRLHNPRCL